MSRLNWRLMVPLLVISLVLSFCVTGAAERKVIKFMHSDTEKPERAQYYEDMAAIFEKANPTIDVQIIPSTWAAIQQNYLTAVAAGDPPDMMRTYAEQIPFYLNKGVMLDITKYFTLVWRNQFNPGILDIVTTPDKKIYSVPQVADAVPLNYHKEILAKYNLKVPTDKASYYEVMDVLKTKGYENPMQLHGSMSDDFFNLICLQFVARDGVKPVDLAYGKVPFNSKTIVDTLKQFKELYDKGYLARNFWSVGGTDGRMGYSQGKYVFKMGWFWDVYTHRDMGMPLENQGAASFPNLVGVKNIYRLVSVPGFFVTKTSKYPAECVKFLRFLSEEEAQKAASSKYFGGELGMPMVNKKLVYPSEYTQVYTVQFKNGTAYNIFGYDPQIADLWTANVSAIMLGQKTPEQFAGEWEALRLRLGPH